MSYRHGGCAVGLAVLLAGLGVSGATTKRAAHVEANPPAHHALAAPDAATRAPATAHDAVSAPRQLFIVPASVALRGPNASERIIVEGLFADGHAEDLTARAALAVADPGIAQLNQAQLFPTRDGRTRLVASYAGVTARSDVAVSKIESSPKFSFRNDVLPVMSKVGCNSGACHGAAAGKNGFKLTLRGYDPEVDYYTLTRQCDARRTDRLEPARSLMLLKPTATIPHGGGRRFAVGSLEYQILSGWIAEGMPAPGESDARVTGIEILPTQLALKPGAQQQLLVRAHFSDGQTRDVTHWARFTSTDMSVASVDDEGLVKMTGYGEAPVTAWYQSRVAVSFLSVPFPAQIDAATFQRAPRHNYVDDLVLKKLETLRIPPSRQTTDAEFLRRAYLDAAGILPTAAETERFLSDSAAGKRARLIEALLARPEFTDYWAYKWSDLLLVSTNKLPAGAMWSYYNWVRQGVDENRPWDRFVYQLVTVTGDSRENGAANYWAIHRDPIDISENLAKAFMGLSINCAHCHNHPLEKWTQKDYFAMANLFSRVRLKTDAGGFDEVTVFDSNTGDVNHPRLGKPLPPQPIEGPALPLESAENRRAYFAAWLTSPENPYFARCLVNRVWKNFMGRGLTEAVDDLRATNPPANQELFDALTRDFIAHHFDVKYLVRTVMNSATYQTASEPVEANASDTKYYSHYIIKRLPAEVYLDALSQVTQSPEKFDGYALGMRALQLPDTKVQSYFLNAFGRPPRLASTAAERMSSPNIAQALHVINGDTLNNKLRAPDGTVAILLKLGVSDLRMIDYLFLSAFNRVPSEAERQALLSDLHGGEGASATMASYGPDVSARRQALEDLMWAMLTSKEFMFNH